MNSVASHRNSLLLAGGAFLLVFILWQTGDNNSPILYPFRLLVTFVHEAGHGISAIVTGGEFRQFTVYPNGAGVATTAGGSRFVILQMGYLGAALFGAILLYAANRARNPQWVAIFAGMFFIGCAMLFTGRGSSALLSGAVIFLVVWIAADFFSKRNAHTARLLQMVAVVILGVTLISVANNTALLTGIIAGGAFTLLSAFGSPSLTLFLLNSTALIVGFNAVNDIIGLWNNQTASLGRTPNDAYALAQYTNLPTQLWLLVWIAAALLMMGAALYFSFIAPARRQGG
ncbi:MAG: M50 family metallopeptidase [Anaerolineae bacterium]|nr:M50 family metallopeptidase [Anaerolineae bacterium]CAG1015282.1 hypothetical protein ANRL4_05449 [Anaerolineae bacterium]